MTELFLAFRALMQAGVAVSVAALPACLPALGAQVAKATFAFPRATIANPCFALAAGTCVVVIHRLAAFGASDTGPLIELGVGTAGVVAVKNLVHDLEKIRQPASGQRLADRNASLSFAKVVIFDVGMGNRFVSTSRIGIDRHDFIRTMLAQPVQRESNLELTQVDVFQLDRFRGHDDQPLCEIEMGLIELLGQPQHFAVEAIERRDFLRSRTAGQQGQVAGEPLLKSIERLFQVAGHCGGRQIESMEAGLFQFAIQAQAVLQIVVPERALSHVRGLQPSDPLLQVTRQAETVAIEIRHLRGSLKRAGECRTVGAETPQANSRDAARRQWIYSAPSILVGVKLVRSPSWSTWSADASWRLTRIR